MIGRQRKREQRSRGVAIARFPCRDFASAIVVCVNAKSSHARLRGVSACGTLTSARSRSTLRSVCVSGPMSEAFEDDGAGCMKSPPSISFTTQPASRTITRRGNVQT